MVRQNRLNSFILFVRSIKYHMPTCYIIAISLQARFSKSEHLPSAQITEFSNNTWHSLFYGTVTFFAMIQKNTFSKVITEFWVTTLKCIFNFNSFSSSILRPPGCREEPLDGDTAVVSTIPNVRTFDDPSEPIYTDPSLFERSRSLRSIAVSQAGQHCQEVNIWVNLYQAWLFLSTWNSLGPPSST